MLCITLSIPEPMRPGTKVIKNPETWLPIFFYTWGAGEGVGEVMPSVLVNPERDGMVDVRWPTGRCFHRVEELIPLKSNKKKERL